MVDEAEVTAITADELEDFVKEEEENNGVANLNEAPASLNIKFWVDDFGVLLTMRSTRVSTLIKQLENMLKVAKEKGWKPSWAKDGIGVPRPPQSFSLASQFDTQRSSPRSQATPLQQAPVCPVHGAVMRLRDGKWGQFYSCGFKDASGQWCKQRGKPQ